MPCPPLVRNLELDAFSASSAVITQDQLRDQNAVDLASALRRTPGVQISRYNPVGAFGGDQGCAVYILGMGASRPGSEIKTYVDGVPFYMGLWNHPLLDLLPVNGMQSITVYKSPQPQINGNNFASIDLRTRRATEDGVHGDAWDGVFGLYRQQVDQSRHYTVDMVVPARMPYLDSQSRNKGESVSAYGDVTWYVTPKADLSAGLRLSHDTAQTNFAGDMMGTPIAGDRSVRQNTWLGRIGAGYRFAPQWRGYVNVAQGYKPAGFALAPTSAADAEGFGRERSTSYEIGARYTSGSLRLGMAAYHVDTRNAQLYGDSNMGYQTLKNVGDTRSTGLEFSADWDAARDWALGAAGFVSDAKFRRYTDASACADCNGNHVPFVPEHGLTLSAKGRVRLGDAVLRPRTALRYVGTHYFDTANTLRQGGYTLIDAGLAWMPVRDLEVAFYVNNLTDKDYRTYGFSYGAMGNFAQVGTGRSFGVTLTCAY